jgi:hypothetical protein
MPVNAGEYQVKKILALKNGRKGLFIPLAMAAMFLASCASTGQFMPLASGEKVLGTAQASFVSRNTLNSRNAINTQAYIKLLEAAQRQYSSNGMVDIRDVIWASGRSVDAQNTEYTATGKVVQVQ